MKIKRNPIAIAIKTALYSSLLASVAITGVAFAQVENDDGSKEELDKVVVTGSRIKRSDIEGAVPVTVITREDIELSGQTNVADLLRSTTFNSAGSFRPQSGSSAQGVSTVSLRGIGASRTLILIDGRRLPTSPSTGSSQDLNTIPLGMVERIEILSDGASAIYGSDAIGGVVNVITRSDFTGVQITLGGAEVSIPTNGGERSDGSVIFGAANDTSNIIAGVSWNDREMVFARDFPWVGRGGSIYSNNFTRADETTGPYIAVRGGCDFPDRAFYILDPSDPDSRCAFDFASVSADEASTENKSLFVKAKHDINDNWNLWANAGFYQTSSFGRYAPAPDGSVFSAILSADSINNPSNPNSPHYDPVNFSTPQEVNWWHRFDALGNRDTTVTNSRTNFELGLTGQILDNVEVEFGVTRTNNRTSEIGRNYILRSAAVAAIENGTYLLSSPYTTDPAVLNGMKVTINRESLYDQDEYFASVSFDAFEMTHGAVGVFVGAEFRDIKYADIYDSLSEAGQVGGSAGNSAAGTRDVTAVFFETLFPLLENLEMNIAGRFDDYSDYGSDFSPKISFRYQPLDNLTLRASYGEGFRAPTLDILTQQDAFSASPLRGDAASCLAAGLPITCQLQVTTTVTANPSLQSEQSKQFSLGVAYEPVEWFNGTLDYFNIEIDNRIRQFTTQNLVTSLRAGDFIPAGLGCIVDPATDAIVSCISGFGNEGLVNVSGLDLNLRFNYEALGGNLSHQLQWSHLLKTSLDGGRDLINDPGTPADRMVINNRYSYGDWSFAYNLNLIGDQYDRVQVLDSVDDEDIIAALADPVEVTSLGGTSARYRSGHVPTWVTHDIQLNYHAPWDGRITLGVNNVGEKAPPIGVGFLQSRDYDFRLYDGFGRVTYLRYQQTF